MILCPDAGVVRKKAEETMTHLFLTAPNSYGGNLLFVQELIDIEEMTLKHLINKWWSMQTTIPTIIMWTLWKRRNVIKHGGKVTFSHMIPSAGND